MDTQLMWWMEQNLPFHLLTEFQWYNTKVISFLLLLVFSVYFSLFHFRFPKRWTRKQRSWLLDMSLLLFSLRLLLILNCFIDKMTCFQVVTSFDKRKETFYLTQCVTFTLSTRMLRTECESIIEWKGFKWQFFRVWKEKFLVEIGFKCIQKHT